MARPITLDLPEDTARALDEVARATERSDSAVIIDALQEYLSEYRDATIARERSLDKSDRTISSEDLHRWLGERSNDPTESA